MQQGQTQGSQLGKQTVGLMATPPAVVTDKDHLYLKDALSWELLAMKKCSDRANRCQDQEIRNFVNGVGQMHQDHYGRLACEVDPNKTLH